MPETLPEVLLLALTILVMSLHLEYLWSVRTAVPHEDEWRLLDEMFEAFDKHRAIVWVLSPHNGHFLVPGNLAYLLSARCLSLDLTPLRLLNSLTCLVTFILTAHVINTDVRSWFLRFYLYLGACFVIFNLCFWEHFSLAIGFTAILSALFGGIGLYYIAKATQASANWKKDLLVGLVFLLASVLSLGAGYAAAAAAFSLLALDGLKKLVSQRTSGYKTVVYCLACAFGLLAIVSHPFVHLKSWIIQTVFHSVLVAGSVGSSFLDKNSGLAQNVAFACGVILVVASLSIGFDFLTRQTPRRRLLPTFAFALVLFGLFGCVAVAVARSQRLEAEFLSSRYTLYPSICVLGILLYFACWRVFFLTNMWCFAAAGYLVGTVNELQVARYRPAVYNAIEVAIRNIDNLSDEQLRATLYFRENTKGVRRVAARMRRDRLNLFRRSSNVNAAQP